VLCDYVRKGHIGWQAAIDLVRDILFKNARKLYNLDIEFTELVDEPGPPAGSYQTDAELLQAFLRDQPTPDFVRIFWNDFTATQRMRMIPFRKFMSLVNDGLSPDIGITTAVFALLQNDRLLPNVFPSGEYRLHPDFSSLKKGPIDGHISMAGEFREQSGAQVPYCPRSVLHRAVEYGAQNNLSFLVGFEIEFLLLERDATPLGGNSEGSKMASPSQYSTLATDGHAWSVARYFSNPRVATLLRDMVSALADTGIYVEQLHAESATGQFELILPPYPPVEAADTLLHARDIMSALAAAAGFKISLHPKPFPNACGTASHMHISLAPIRPVPAPRRKSSVSASAAVAAAVAAAKDAATTTTIPETAVETAVETTAVPPSEAHKSFYAGVLKHLRAIAAFTLPSPASYDRCSDGTWSGGRWVAWGTQNRETALRKIEGSHWEVRCFDGLANPYLAIAAVLFAGVKGYSDGEPLVWGDCEIDPAKLTENDRAELGVTQMLPGSVADALETLKKDEELVELMGPELVERYAAVKEMEVQFLGEMGHEERRRWLMERY
jgi:glutamine synthetase